jgi:hypothetical protein
MILENQIKNEYFDWLYNYVCKGRAHDNVSYRKIFMLLHNTEFTFSIAKDFNRAKDGVDLRYRFAILNEDRWDAREVLDILDGACSVLEMMIALAVICEESIMDDSKYGDRTGQWFWNMMYNLGIDYMFDDIYDENVAIEIIDAFLERRYEPDGKGGLFYIRGCREDLRNVEIWYQLCWYLDGYA